MPIMDGGLRALIKSVVTSLAAKADSAHTHVAGDVTDFDAAAAAAAVTTVEAFSPCDPGNQLSYAAIGFANRVHITGFWLPYRVVISKLRVNIITASGAHNYSLGIYDRVGTRLATTGAVSTGVTTGIVELPLVAPVTLNPGFYILAATTDFGTAPAIAVMRPPAYAGLCYRIGYLDGGSVGGELPAALDYATFTEDQSNKWYALFMA